MNGESTVTVVGDPISVAELGDIINRWNADHGSRLEEHHFVFYGELESVPSRGKLNHTIDHVVETIGMTKIAPIVGHDCTIIPGERCEFHPSGRHYQRLQLIAESHVGIEGDGLLCRGEIFSCKAFDPARAGAVFAVMLGGKWAYARLGRALTPQTVEAAL
jgi:hypothetical protein